MSECKTTDHSTKLLFLGVGNAFSEGMDYSSTLMDDKVLVDPSPTCVARMKEVGIDLAGIEAVFITHLHGDHILGFPFLVLDYTFKVKRERPLQVVCPEGGAETLMKIVDLAFSGIPHIDNVEVEFHEIKEEDHGVQKEVVGIPYTPYSTCHGTILSFGYAIHVDGVDSPAVGFTGDTGPCPGLDGLAAAVKALVIEMAQEASNIPAHMGVDDIIALRKTMPADVTIMLTHHYGPGVEVKQKLETMVEGQIIVAQDLQCISLGLTI